MTPLARYQEDLKRPDFFHDAAQETAVRHLQRLYDDLLAAHSRKPGLLGSVTSRAEAQVMRLALIYALLDCSPLIRPDHLLAALAVWGYCEQSAAYIFGDALGDPIADELLRAIRATGNQGMTRTEIRDLFKRHKGAEQIGRVLLKLLEYGSVRTEKITTCGRPVERWFASYGCATKATKATEGA